MGIYLHIPFCASRCIYCDFYSTTQSAQREAYVRHLEAELLARRGEAHARVHTIYIGGGTPSQLSPAQLRRLLAAVYEAYDVAPDAEVTLEANPDDLTPAFLAALPPQVNRLSLGVQTFDDALLHLLRRRHTARQAIDACTAIAALGAAAPSLSIDLIYGLPGQTLAQWERDLATALHLPIHHLSAYSLMVEEGTPLWQLRRRSELREAPEELSLSMYTLLLEGTARAGFEHYELSNFARPGHASRHNSSYWTGTPYLGFGPGAHGYDGGATRRENLPDLAAYLAAPAGAPPHRLEHLSEAERYDEAVMCALRTRRGLDLAELRRRFGDRRADYCLCMAEPHLRAGRLVVDGGRLRLTRAGLFVSDDVMSDLMDV